jgi:hypothetical protein
MAYKGILWLRLLQICFTVKSFDGLLLVGKTSLGAGLAFGFKRQSKGWPGR